jgi:Putative auto-transporter adhesin, head GIN domain
MRKSPNFLEVCVFLVLFGGIAGCNLRLGAGIKGSGVSKTEQRPVGAFARIEVGSAVHLDWQTGKEPSLEVTAEDNLLPHLVTEVVGDTLKIYFDVNVNATKDIVVKAASRDLDGLTGSGASQSTLKGVHSDDFKLELSGASQCTLTGHAKSLAVECSGASSAKSDGFEAGAATVVTSGASSAEIPAKKLRSVSGSGASKATVSAIDADELKLELSGSSRCTLSGQVKQLTIEAAGASTVHAAELKAKSVKLDVSGASHIEVEALESITGAAHGGSHVRYLGAAEPKVRTSGGASVQKK